MQRSLVTVCILGMLVACSLAASSIMDNMQLRISTINRNPYIFYDPDLIGNSRFDGFAVDLLDAVLAKAGNNITYTLSFSPDGVAGAVDANGNWNGVMGQVLKGNADFGIGPLTLTAARLKGIGFVSPFRVSGLRVMVLKPIEKNDQMAFLKPFSARLWVVLLFTAAFMGVVLYIFDAVSPYGFRKVQDDDEARRTLNLPSSLFASLSTMIGAGGHPMEYPRSWSTRIIVLVYFFFVVIIISSYTANLTAFLTVKRLSTQITSVNDLKAKQLNFAVVNSSSIQSFFLNTDIIEYSVLKHLMVPYPSFDACLQAVRKGEISALIHDSEIVDYFVDQQPCDTLQVGEIFDPGFYGFPILKNSSIKDVLSVAVAQVMEAGIADDLHNKWYKEMGTCTSGEGNVDADRLDLSNLGGLFYMLFIFIGVAFLILLGEIGIHMNRNRNEAFVKMNKFCGNHERDVPKMRKKVASLEATGSGL